MTDGTNSRNNGAPQLRLIGGQTTGNLWKGVVGQQRLRDFISKIIETLAPRGKQFPHAMFTGPAGCGKTLLASNMAQALGNEFVSFLGTPDLCRNDLAYIFSSVKRGAIVHIDEAHSLQKCCHEFFYQLIDQRTIPTPGEKRPDVTRKILLTDVTLIFSTNYPGKIPKPLRTRLMMFELDEYSNDDLKELARMKMPRGFQDRALDDMVTAAQGNPRLLLQSIAQLELIDPFSPIVTSEAIQMLFRLKDTGPKGLSKLQQDYLLFLETQPECRALVTTLCQQLGVDESYLRREIEPYLVKCGFVSYGAPGRKLSKRGRFFTNGELSFAKDVKESSPQPIKNEGDKNGNN